MTDSPALLPRLAHAAVTGVKLLAALALAIVVVVIFEKNEKRKHA